MFSHKIHITFNQDSHIFPTKLVWILQEHFLSLRIDKYFFFVLERLGKRLLLWAYFGLLVYFWVFICFQIHLSTSLSSHEKYFRDSEQDSDLKNECMLLISFIVQRQQIFVRTAFSTHHTISRKSGLLYNLAFLKSTFKAIFFNFE